jgi:hypothetical protein
MIYTGALYMASALLSLAVEDRDYTFDKSISRSTLENYFSRAVTHSGLCSSSADPTTQILDDDIRMLRNIGAKFVGRAAFVWDLPRNEEGHFRQTKAAAAKVHKADPEIVLQACVFEAVFPGVAKIPMPAWVFKESGIPVEKRNFDYEAMLYRNGRWAGHWGKRGSVPDMSRLETRLWFYYRCRRYIDCGIEAIHFGQVKIMDDADPGHRHWIDILDRVRAYARKNARRHLVLCDAHTHGEVEDGELLFDFHSFPLRIAERKGKPQEGVLSRKHSNSIYGRSKGGVTPNGWSCKSLPYLVEFDNFGYSGKGGQSVKGIWVWGYDEISWFAHQDKEYRANWLRYAVDWVKENDPHGYVQMPARRTLAAPLEGNIRIYRANRRSAVCPGGFDMEQAIREIWQKE